ncbi:hypothetical protein [Teredinibacter purpureus]|uniref:hypothetical protein n=1 Tax=Teredinibacter purpureus TaxID=2731756 RepID=UPI0005F7D600|nr:hypothetical protein [Teredinibacter purpureus]
MRKVKESIIELIMNGKVIMATMKAATQNGSQFVSVGPYQSAVGESSFAVIEKSEASPFVYAVSAAEEFIALVGKDIAWRSAQKVLASL